MESNHGVPRYTDGEDVLAQVIAGSDTHLEGAMRFALEQDFDRPLGFHAANRAHRVFQEAERPARRPRAASPGGVAVKSLVESR